MKGKGLIIAVLGVGAGLGGLIVGGQRATGREFAGIRSGLTEVRKDITDLRERMAQLEGLFESFTKREAMQ